MSGLLFLFYCQKGSSGVEATELTTCITSSCATLSLYLLVLARCMH